MNSKQIEEILRLHREGSLDTDQATERIKHLSFEDIGYARVDHARASRQGFPEVIFGQGKTREQVIGIFEKLAARSPNVMVTRTSAEVFGDVRNIATDAEWHESAKVIRLFRDNWPVFSIRTSARETQRDNQRRFKVMIACRGINGTNL